MKKKAKKVTEKHTTIIPTGQPVGLYIDGKLVAVCEPIEFSKVELNKN